VIAVALEELRQHAEELTEQTGINLHISQEGAQVYIILGSLPLPARAYQVANSDVLFITDTMYPLSAMDMFWTDPAVVRPDGSIPAGAESIETYSGRQWRRFSWHRNGIWNPNGNPLLDHFEFMQARFVLDLVA
jgi:Prokaryotic E2 family E